MSANSSIEHVKSDLDAIIEKYAEHQDLTADKPPAIGTYWNPTRGDLRVIEDTVGYEHSFTRRIEIGVAIGTRFGNFDGKLQSRVKDEVKEALKVLVEKYGGFIMNCDGSGYSQIGWVKNG
jgi:hypothetical protein